MLVLPVSTERYHPDTLRWSPDGRTLGVVGNDTRVLYRIDPATGAVRPLPRPCGHDTPHYGFAADGSAVAYRMELARVYAPDATEDEQRVIAFPQIGYGMAVSPDGRTLAVSGSEPGEGGRLLVARYDLATGEPRPAVGYATAGVGVLAFSADGGRLISGHMKQLRVWDVGPEPAARAAAVLKVTEGGWLRTVALSADGRFAAAVARTTGYLWDTHAKGRQPVVFTGRGRSAAAVAFHPSRPLFATAGTDRTVTFWDPAGGQPVRKFAWDIGELTNVTFSPDGYQAAAAGDGRVVVWDVD